MRRAFLPLITIASALIGCVRTEVTQQSFSTLKHPLSKVLVCSLSPSTERAEQTEASMASRLQAHHLAAETCSKWLSGGITAGSDALKSSATASGFDSML